MQAMGDSDATELDAAAVRKATAVAGVGKLDEAAVQEVHERCKRATRLLRQCCAAAVMALAAEGGEQVTQGVVATFLRRCYESIHTPSVLHHMAAAAWCLSRRKSTHGHLLQVDGAGQLMDLSDITWKRLCPRDPLFMGSSSSPAEDTSGSSPAAHQLPADGSPRSSDSGFSGLGLGLEEGEPELPLEDQTEYMHALEWLLSALFTLIGGAPKVISVCNICS
jgi:hypothetical protein